MDMMMLKNKEELSDYVFVAKFKRLQHHNVAKIGLLMRHSNKIDCV